MPYFGLFPFLPGDDGNLVMSKEVVSMPYFGLFPFLRNLVMSKEVKEACFNALLRAFSFSTVYDKLLSVLKQRVSMPYFGLFPFLHIEALTESIDRLGFNALLRAFSFSTNDYTKKVNVKFNKFQCPTSGFFLFYAMSLQPLILLAFQPPFCK